MTWAHWPGKFYITAFVTLSTYSTSTSVITVRYPETFLDDKYHRYPPTDLVHDDRCGNLIFLRAVPSIERARPATAVKLADEWSGTPVPVWNVC